MEVAGKYRVRIRSRVIEIGDYTDSAELVKGIGGTAWAWLETLIDELLDAGSLSVQHPSGRPWRFVVLVNYYGRKEAKQVIGVRLWTMPREIRGRQKIQTILFRADQPLRLEDIVSYLQHELGT